MTGHRSSGPVKSGSKLPQYRQRELSSARRAALITDEVALLSKLAQTTGEPTETELTAILTAIATRIIDEQMPHAPSDGWLAENFASLRGVSPWLPNNRKYQSNLRG